jgi:serine/threonine protein kinase
LTYRSRDIHPNNVLVKLCDYGLDSYHNFILADLGEGKTTSTSLSKHGTTFFSGNKLVKLTEYLAPEVPTQGFSKASDVFAFGKTCLDMIRFNSRRLSMEVDGEEQLLIPGKLLGLLRLCIREKPEERLEARHINHMLDEVEKDIRREQATWFKGYDFGGVENKGYGSMSLPESLAST